MAEHSDFTPEEVDEMVRDDEKRARRIHAEKTKGKDDRNRESNGRFAREMHDNYRKSQRKDGQ